MKNITYILLGILLFTFNCLGSDLPKLEESIKKLRSKFGLKPYKLAIIVDISEQKLYLTKGKEIIKTYPVSTSKYGIGNGKKSGKTPLGTHRVCEKIGENAEIGTVFYSCTNTGRIATIYTDETDTPDDLVVTRILRLEGLEKGINKGGDIDSYYRFIYIHGTHEEGLIGKPASSGCIRMKNKDVIELFNVVPIGALVEIQE